jgi:hypothetical protein
VADYFTETSLVMNLPSQEAVRYAIDLTHAMKDCALNDVRYALDLQQVDTELEIIPEGWKADIEDESWCFDVKEEHSGGPQIWIHSENGCIDEIIKLIQHLMVKFDLKEPIPFSWSQTCSKPRIDGFGGGAAVVTATSVRSISTAAWLYEQEITAGRGSNA